MEIKFKVHFVASIYGFHLHLVDFPFVYLFYSRMSFDFPNFFKRKYALECVI